MCHYIHRDVKPANILTGLGSNAQLVYLADFGLARQFRDPGTHIHIPLSKNCSFTGTPAFASINAHLGLGLSRRDDIESLAYVLIYLLQGTLPWIGIQSRKRILRQKQQISTGELCAGLPGGFRLILEHSRALEFNKIPDYDLLQSYICDIRTTVTDAHKMFNWQELSSLAPPEISCAASKDNPQRRKLSRDGNLSPHER